MDPVPDGAHGAHPHGVQHLEYASIMRAQARMSKVAELGGLLQVTQDMDKARGYIAQLNELLVDRRGIRRWICPRCSWPLRPAQWDSRAVHDLGACPSWTRTYTEMGDMVVLGGYPSAGKTALAVSMAYHQAKTHRWGFTAWRPTSTSWPTA